MNFPKIHRKKPNTTTWAHLVSSQGSANSSGTGDSSGGASSDSANSQNRSAVTGVTIDSYVATAGGYTSIYVGDIIRASQSFQPKAFCTLTKMYVRMKKLGLPTGSATCVIYDSSGTYGSATSVPNSVVTGTSDNFDVSTLTTTDTEVVFTFTTQPKLLPTSFYFFSINYNDGTSTVAKCPMLGYVTAGTDDGTSATYVAAWAAATPDYPFRLIGTEPR